jgi:hypothetical protein
MSGMTGIWRSNSARSAAGVVGPFAASAISFVFNRAIAGGVWRAVWLFRHRVSKVRQ